jgi:hypothetical protein
MIKKFFEFNNQDLDKIQMCANSVLEFLDTIECKNWNHLVDLDRYSREIVNDIINNYCETIEELNEVKFLIRLKLSNKKQLQSLLKEYESIEDYEKCQLILKQINLI